MPRAAGADGARSRATCDHCGLPLGRRPVVTEIDGASLRCCCYGCVLAHQVTRAAGEDGAAAAIYVRLGLGVFFAINVMMVSMPAYVPYVYGAAAGPVDGPLFQILRVLAIVLTLPVLVLLGGPIVSSAWSGLRHGAANTDALIVLGTVAAYGLSVANTVAGRPAVYFDTAAMLLVLVTVGRFLEASAKAEAGRAVRSRLAPGPPRALREDADGTLHDLAADALAPGDVVRVGPGDAFPTDGVVVSGEGGVDEATLTGESWPVAKTTGSAISGGTCSVDGVFRVRVTRPAHASAAARIGDLLAAALQERTPWERTADRAARVLVPAVVVLALVAGTAWTATAGIERGLMVAIAILVVACPCGLGIATPVAIWTGLAAASRRGVIVRSAPALERAAAVATAVFDKTGTLTTRTPRLAAVDVTPGTTRAEVLALAAAVANGLTHPLSQAIVAAVRTSPRVTATSVRSLPGLGATGVVGGTRITIGSPRLAVQMLGADAATGAAGGGDGPRVCVLADDRLLAVLRFAEEPRPEAASALSALRRLGVRCRLATGDAQATAVVPALIGAADAQMALLPADKLRRVGELRGAGLVAMVGDGVNDAPAVAGADLGIALGSATDLTRTTADVVILSDDLRRVPWLVGHARRVGRVARQNLAWAFGYNAVAVVLAAAGQLGPLVAAAAMIASSLAVVANARRLAADRPLDLTG